MVLCSGLSRALKTPHRGVFAPRYAERGARAVLVPPMVHPFAASREIATKKQPYAYRKAVCAAPCGSKPEHFCVSGRHRHHTAAHPEVMPVVPPREDKRGMLKYQGAFAAYPRSTNWAAVFHSPLDISPSLFFRLIAEQPTIPYSKWNNKVNLENNLICTTVFFCQQFISEYDFLQSNSTPLLQSIHKTFHYLHHL